MRRALFILPLVLLAVLAAQTQPSPNAVTIACRALEVHEDLELKTAVIVFHQADQSQGSELAVLLRDHSGQTVEIQGADGGWHSARMDRMKTNFGRGMLLLASPSPVAEHSQFLLRVPGGAAPPKATR